MPSLIRVKPGWRPPASWRRLGTIESHAAGEPLRVLVEGLDPIPGATILEKRRFARERVDVPGIGEIRYDLAFGGAFYAFVDAASIGLALTPDRFRDLISAGTAIKRAVQATREVRHPGEADLSFLYGTIFTGPAITAGADSRNVCVFAE